MQDRESENSPLHFPCNPHMAQPHRRFREKLFPPPTNLFSPSQFHSHYFNFPPSTTSSRIHWIQTHIEIHIEYVAA